MIKYHDNTSGVQYGEDHALTNNWNPDLDYGNEYVNIYFRMNTKGYDYPSFSFTESDRKDFEEDIRKVFTALGWNCKEESHNGVCSTWCNGKSHLYLHPQNFSGEVLKNEVKAVAEALENNGAFELRWVDLYETVYDVTDDEYEAMLSEKDEEIKKAVLETCKTKRKSNFYFMSGIARIVADRFRIKRIGEDNRYTGLGQATNHVIDIIGSLIEEGYLVKHGSGNDMLVRTINKTEQKQKKLFIA